MESNEREYLAAIVQSSNDAIIGTTLDGIIQSWNIGAENIFGYNSLNMKGRHISLAIPKNYLLEESGIIEEIRKGNSVEHYETFGKRKDGKEFHISLTISPIRNRSGDVIGASQIARDTASRFKMEAELKLKAEELSILKDAFLANMSHEIRTPLNAIIGFTDMLLKKNLEAQEKDYAETIKHAGENLLAIINDILDTSKIEAGMMSFEERPLSIKAIFKSLNTMLEQKTKEKKLQLLFRAGNTIPDILLGDSVRLTQVIINLVSNAIKFTKKGKIDVTAKLVQEETDDVTVKFSVKDTGIGIADDKRQYIFERFRQAESHTTRKYGGTGLGLNIVKNLVELQGGKMEVESDVNIGSVFSFTLTFKRSTEVQSKPKEVRKFNVSKLRKLNILMVEDNPLNIKLVESLFSQNSLKLQVAENGIEGVEKLRGNDFDIVLMDMEMPLMNGYQATTVIRQELKSNIPIIAMTAHAMAGEREKCLQLGMNDYISKPINANLLFATIYDLTRIHLHPKGRSITTITAAPAMKREKVCNFTYLMDMTKGNMEIINTVIAVFLEETPGELSALDDAIKKINYKVIGDISHKIKSSFSIMGISVLQPIFEEMEYLGNMASGIEKIEKLNRSISPVFIQAIEEMKQGN